MTATEPRSFGTLFGEIVRDIQQIFRGEVRLAKIELVREVAKLKSGLVFLAVASVAGVLGLAYLMLAAVLAIGQAVPLWGAALIVAGVVLVLAAVLAMAGLSQVRKIRGTPRTIRSIKETV